MGRPKLLLPYRGKPLLAWTLELVEALPVERRLLVLGAQADDILKGLFHPSPMTRDPSIVTRDALRVTRHGKPWQVIYNPDWRRGMGTSLRRAAQEAPAGMLVFLGDMPEVPRAAAEAVLAGAGDRPVAPSYRGRRGFPIYLPPSLRPRLLELSGDVGARELVRESCVLIPWTGPEVILDVDQEEDLPCARPARLTS